MKGMFERCNALSSINLSNFQTSEKLTDISSLFYNCISLINCSLQNITLGENCLVNNAFYGCTNVLNLDMSYFNIPNNLDYNLLLDGTNLRSLTVNLTGTNDNNLKNYIKSSGAFIINDNKNNDNEKKKKIPLKIISPQNDAIFHIKNCKYKNNYIIRLNNNLDIKPYFNINNDEINNNIKELCDF